MLGIMPRKFLFGFIVLCLSVSVVLRTQELTRDSEIFSHFDQSQTKQQDPKLINRKLQESNSGARTITKKTTPSGKTQHQVTKAMESLSESMKRSVAKIVTQNVTTESAVSMHPYFSSITPMGEAELPTRPDSPIEHNLVSFPECAASTSARRLLLILVLSRPGSSEVRGAIRQTYGSPEILQSAPTAVRVVFLLGNFSTSSPELQNEMMRHNDLLVGDFTDTYKNLVNKVRFGLEWALHDCPQAEWIVKIDDDRLLHVPVVSSFLLVYGQGNAIYGNFHPHGAVHRNDSSKWEISEAEYPIETFPAYANGPCYILSRDAAESILGVWGTRPSFSLEDVYITGILADFANVSKVHVKNFVAGRVKGQTLGWERFRLGRWMTGEEYFGA